NPCSTVGTTGSCTITLTSSTPGTTVVSAHTTVSVSGVSLTRNTTGGANSGPANKLWADDSVATHVRDANGSDVTNQTVPAGTPAHDGATGTRLAGPPAGVPDPTGTVTFTLFPGNGCTGNALAPDANKPLNASGLATSATFTTPAAGGQFSYSATYS